MLLLEMTLLLATSFALWLLVAFEPLEATKQ